MENRKHGLHYSYGRVGVPKDTISRTVSLTRVVVLQTWTSLFLTQGVGAKGYDLVEIVSFTRVVVVQT